MAKINKLESRKFTIHIRCQYSNKKPGTSISVYQEKTPKILKTMTTYKMYFFWVISVQKFQGPYQGTCDTTCENLRIQQPIS